MSDLSVSISHQGQFYQLSNVTTETTAQQLYQRVLHTLQLNENDFHVKVLFKGKDILKDQTRSNEAVFTNVSQGSKIPKLLVVASPRELVDQLNAKRSDPTIRGLAEEDERQRQLQLQRQQKTNWWGSSTQPQPHRQYKFVRLEACTWQSFGHRADDKTPHAFRALELLERLSTDPGIVQIMIDRELVVNTLGEMDPIDDRIRQKKEAQGQGVCLLGYNTNHGLRIDVRLRTQDLKGFLPYPDVVATLIHELSHNWVGEHDLLFWTNYGQMRCEYLYTHARLAASGVIARGQSTANLAGVSDKCHAMDQIGPIVLREMEREMAQHGLHPQMIASAILEHAEMLLSKGRGEQRLGGVNNGATNGSPELRLTAPRELMLAAAERRAREQQQQPKPESNNSNISNDESKNHNASTPN